MLTSETPNIVRTGRYNTTVAAQRLGIHRNTLRLIPEEDLPRHHFDNGRVCFLGKDLLRYWHTRVS